MKIDSAARSKLICPRRRFPLYQAVGSGVPLSMFFTIAARIATTIHVTQVANVAVTLSVARVIIRLVAYLPFLQSSNPVAEPQWPQSVQERMDLAPSTAMHVAPQVRGRTDIRTDDDGASAPLDALIRRVPLCILRDKAWSGDLGTTVLYHSRHIDDDRVTVGYFAYWTTERPFGDNELTRWVLPAVAIDAVYSHLLFVLPGLQQLLYGPGDVEGVRVTYRIADADRLVPVNVTADDRRHHEVALNLAEAVDERGRVLVLNDTWSHQLGGRGAVTARRAGASMRCFVGDALRVLPDETVRAFRLGSIDAPRRAKPAWRLGVRAESRI